ncbi:MAG: glucosylglycerol-phosphate synthase [Alphaproteobacteria bacterium]|nr:glucosylglycerol-phosphate synthase [Alphaproteobacteria bacterium]
MNKQLIIVYHRQPYTEVREPDGTVTYVENKSPNGIVPTLKSFFAHVEKGAWVAWRAVVPGSDETWERRITFEDSHGSYEVVRLPLRPEQVRRFYHETSKEAFWPILHSFPWHCNVDGADWDTFVEVNQRFADGAIEIADDDALIWVHDYNLWLVPGMIRKQRPNARIAFFHHTPFPAADIFNILPWRTQIIDSLLACDLVGFHIPRYAANFAGVARSLRDVDITTEEVPDSLRPVGAPLFERETPTKLTLDGHDCWIDACPVGTNPLLIDSLLAEETAERTLQRLYAELGDQRLIVSIGRVDYVKGTTQLLEAFERLLERRPDLHGKLKLCVTSVMAAAGMQVYDDAKAQIEGLVGRINGRFSNLAWTPVLLFTNALPFDEVIAYYRMAHICWVTPLRDGLNLVAKEYVAAHRNRGGVLVLSEFTGVAVELPEAVMTNPYSDKSMDEAIEQALAMPDDEQRRRMAAMYERVVEHDIGHWAEHCFQAFDNLDRRGVAKPAPAPGPVVEVTPPAEA